jgi:hypothetical protein
VPAVEICSRCGTFLCGECVEYFHETTPACASCLPLLKGSPASMRAKLSPTLSIVALLGWLGGFVVPGRAGLLVWGVSFPVGFAGLALAVQELRLIRAGQAGARGRWWARVGLGLGVSFALLFGALIASFLLFTWRTYVKREA